MSEGKLRAGLALGYAIVGVALAAGVAGLIIALAHPGAASKVSVQAIAAKLDPTKTAAVQAACSKVASEANAQGVIITACHLIKDKAGYQVKGDGAQVTVEAKSESPKGTFIVTVALSKGVWIATGFQIVAAVPGK